MSNILLQCKFDPWVRKMSLEKEIANHSCLENLVDREVWWAT